MRRYSESTISPRSTVSRKIKKMLIPLSILIFFGNTQNCNGSNEFHEDSCCWKFSGKISEVFSSLYEKGLEILPCYYPKRFIHLEGCEIEESTSVENHPIKLLPNELLYQIAINLSPVDILNLTKTNKLFSSLKNNDFWSYYNKEHHFISWNEKLSRIKVSFSYYWFRNNKINKAYAMGLPLAIKFFQQQELAKRENVKANNNAFYFIDSRRYCISRYI